MEICILLIFRHWSGAWTTWIQVMHEDVWNVAEEMVTQLVNGKNQVIKIITLFIATIIQVILFNT